MRREKGEVRSSRCLNNVDKGEVEDEIYLPEAAVQQEDFWLKKEKIKV